LPSGARRFPHRRWPGRAARTVLLAALLLSLTLLSGGTGSPASAAPTQASLEAQLERLNRQADQLVEEYNQSKLALTRLRKTRDELRTQASGAEADLKALRTTLGARAAAAYVQGAGNTLAAVLNSEDPASAIDRVQVLELLANHDGDLMDRLALAGKAYDGRKRDLAAAEREATAEVARLDAKKAEVERAAARTRELLSQLRARNASPSPSPSPSAAPSPPPSSGGGSGGGAVAVSWALSQVGRPYCYGGAGPSCYDCSGLTMRAWGQAGVSLPHSSSAQYGVGRHVSAGELQPGDLIFYYSPISHVSIYIGNGQRVSATHTGDYVRVQSLGSSIVGYSRPNG
jgi:peptidoglycan DL-endopeptidase CwlO